LGSLGPNLGLRRWGNWLYLSGRGGKLDQLDGSGRDLGHLQIAVQDVTFTYYLNSVLE
jgi:hypothetical protein